MKVYTQLIDLSKTTPQNFYVPPHSKFKLGVKLVQSIDFTVKLDGAALESDGEIDGFKTFSLESANPGNTTYVVEAANGQKVKILQTTTNSTVFEVGAAIPEGNFVKTVNGDLPINGNIDVAKLVYVDDDGINAELPAKDIATSLKSIDASLANKLERSDIVPIAPATDAPEEALAGARATADFVNSSIATNTANFAGTFHLESAFPPVATNNDYLFLETFDEEGNKVFKRYKYVADTSRWVYEYTLNNSSFTAAQWAAIQSGITAEIVNDTANSLKTIDDSLSHKLERADIVPIAPATDAPEEALAGARATAEFVNNSIATNTAHFTGTYNSESAFPPVATNNDYLFLDTVDSDGNKILKVYQYAADSSRWSYMYTLNNSSFTAAQLAAIQSGITAGDVADMAKKSELDAHTVVLSGEFEDGTTFNYTVYTK